MTMWACKPGAAIEERRWKALAFASRKRSRHPTAKIKGTKRGGKVHGTFESDKPNG